MEKTSLNEIQTGEPLTWVWATDGRGGHPLGFYCERCGTEVKVSLPMSVKKYVKDCRRFFNEHKLCLAREGQLDEHN